MDLRFKVETWPGDGEWGVWQTTYVGVGGPGERGEEFHAMTGLYRYYIVLLSVS